MLRLVIGNKNYSSWSLRAWLHLRESGVPFEEVHVSLFDGAWRDELRAYTPAGRVPVLVDGDVAVWDSLAIVEYVRETCPGAVGWPEERAARAMARAVAAEMHSGFLAIRDELPQNLRARRPLALADLSDACRSQIGRVEEIVATARERFGSRAGDAGPWLFGAFSIADVMYAPVALRFATYEIPVSPPTRAFVDAVRELPSIREFVRDARAETASLPFIDDLAPAASTPLVPG